MRPLERRTLLGGLTGGLLAGGAAAETATLPFGNGERPLVAYPGKRELLRLTTRPPQLETPFAVFGEGLLTPNDAFFVRYHLADIPRSIDPATFRVAVRGAVATPLSLSLDELKGMGETSLVAVHQCSGNGRGFFEPRVAGGQAGNGLMGNARWTGVTLRAVLERAGVAAGAVQVRFQGLDRPVSVQTPAFVKALPIAQALDGEVMLAWGMNGEELPFLNGYPLRLVVPGVYGTYWMKHLTDITVTTEPVRSFWMDTAYRIPDNDCACTPAGKPAEKTRPIGRFNVRSFITSPGEGEVVPAGAPVLVKGVAFDGGSGIARVELSTDGGRSWENATLAESDGRYAFRGWARLVELEAGTHALRVRATAVSGETQPAEPRWNPSGYMRNVIETVTVRAA